MPEFAVALLALSIVVVLARAPVRYALAGMLSVALLVPDSVPFPYLGVPYMNLQRLALLAFSVGLVRRMTRGEVGTTTLRPTRMHLAVLGFLLVSFAGGMLLADPNVPTNVVLSRWLQLVEQAAFFAVAIVAIRAIGDIRWSMWTLTIVASAAAGIAIVEHFTHWSYARWFYSGYPSSAGLPGNFGLETRAFGVRVRGAAQFSLAFAWVMTMLLPITVAVAARARPRLSVGGLTIGIPILVLASIAWTYTRSAYIGILVVIVLLLVSSRFDPPIAWWFVSVAVAASVLGVPTGLYRRSFGAREAAGSSQVRNEQLPAVLAAVSERPWQGLGLGGIEIRRDVANTDSTFLLAYGEQGVIGLSALGLLLVVGFTAILPSLRAPPGSPELTFGAAALAAFVAGIGGAASFAMLSIPGPYLLFWFVTALGVSLAERQAAPFPATLPLRRMAVRLWLPAGAVAAGIAVAVLAPTSAAVAFRFQTGGVASDALPPEDFVQSGAEFVGDLLIATACELMAVRASSLQDTDLDCLNPRSGVGIGHVRVSSSTLERARDRTSLLTAAAREGVRGFRMFLVREDERLKPNWARTSPLWLGAIGLTIAILLPRRRGRYQEGHGAGDGGGDRPPTRQHLVPSHG